MKIFYEFRYLLKSALATKIITQTYNTRSSDRKYWKYWKENIFSSISLDEISRLSSLGIDIPILGYLGVSGFLGYLATSSAKSDVGYLLGGPDFLWRRRNFTPISLSYRDPYFGLFGSFDFFGGYLATSGAISDVIFLLGNPDFLLRRRNVRDIMCG